MTEPEKKRIPNYSCEYEPGEETTPMDYVFLIGMIVLIFGLMLYVLKAAIR
jgi:hypothetical protein